MTENVKKTKRHWFDLVLLLAVVISAAFALRSNGGFSSSEQVYPASRLTATARPALTPDPLTSYIKRRDETRDKEMQALQTLLDGEKTGDSLRADGEKALLDLTRFSEQELAVEAALGGMGVSGVAYVTNDLAYVYVREKLTEEQAALLFLSVSEITGLSDQNIRVADANSIV